MDLRVPTASSTLVKKMNKVLLATLVLLVVAGMPAAAQQPPVERPLNAAPHEPVAAGTAKQAHDAAKGEHAPAAVGEEHAEEHSVWSGLLWPTVNFLILIGGLWYFLNQPLGAYLRDRHASIRKDLVEAANVKATATAQLAEIDHKLQALPGEIDALRKRGAEEIVAEEQRIAAAAAAERERLLEQTRREIDLQLRLAKRELVEHAAHLAVKLAGERIHKSITPADQDRLVDRYLDQVKRG